MLQAVLARSRAAVLTDEPFCSLPELQFARAALSRLQQPAERLDRAGLLTLLIGATGSGKSLLVRLALRDVARKKQRNKFLLLTPSDWSPCVTADPESTVWDIWTQACEQADIVIAEDLDQLLTMGVPADQVSRWLDRLLSNQTRVVLTTTQAPGQSTPWSLRLNSRLHGGLVARIPSLSSASRRLFLSWAAESAQLALGDDVSDWLSDQPPATPRSLRQWIDRLVAEYAPPARVHDLPAVQRLVLGTGKPRLSLAVITQQVAEEFGVSAQELRTATRVQTYRVPRQCAMLLAHEVGGWPMAEIGRYFGKRTHTSVSYSCKKIQESADQAPSLRSQLQRLQRQLRDRLLTDCG